MRVEFAVPMEGPRTDLHPKGVSRRPGTVETVDDAEGLRLIERGMAFAIDDDGYPIRISSAEHQARQAAHEDEIAQRLAAQDDADRVLDEAERQRQDDPERATQRPPATPERAVTQPSPPKSGAPRGASDGKAAAGAAKG